MIKKIKKINSRVKINRKLVLDFLLLSVSFVSLFLFYSSIKDKLLDLFDFSFAWLFDWLSSLDWYWYLIVMILTAIKPAYTFYNLYQKNKRRRK